MVNKIIFSFLFLPCLLYSQTFSNNVIEPAGSWNASLTKIISVSGLPILQSGVFELNQVNLHLGDDANTRNYSSYKITLQKGSVTIDLVASGGFPNSIIRQIDTKFRYNNVLKRLFEHGGTTQPFHIGYYRSQDDFSAFNGIDPNGDWTITITETSASNGGKFNNIDFVFGAPLTLNSQTSNTAYDSCSSPLCISSNEITIATNDGLTPQGSDMFNGNTTGCSWNAAPNNSSWFKFIATQSNAKITISGISGNIQILGISPGLDNNICTPIDNVVISGGCPADALNDSYFSPQYLNGSTRNSQLNLSGLVIAQEYYFVVDGTGGAISPFYIEMEGANQSCSCFVNTPTVSTTPPSCSSSSITTILNFDSLLNYSFNPVGPTIGALGVISGMIVGTSYTVTSSNGGCTSLVSASFSNAAQLPSLQGTISVTNNSICSVSPICVPTGSNVVINEVNHWPSGGQGLVGTGREYIELYNPTCSPIDISCFILGTRSAPDSNPSGPLQTGGSIIIPSGTILQPKSHYVIGTSSASSNVLSVDFKTNLNLSNYCSTGNFVMPNGDGWLALYNTSGTAIDALYWTVGASQSIKIATPDDDFNDKPCTPSSVGSCSTTGIILPSASEIYVTSPSLINYVGISTPNPLAPTNLTFSRIPDGGVWQGQIVGTIDSNNCNNGICDSTPISTCDGTGTVMPTNGIGPFNYLWDVAAGNQTTQTAIGLCAGNYSVIVTDTANGCQQTFIVTISNNPLNIPTFSPVAAICSGGTLSALPTTSINGITGTWSPMLNNTATTTYIFTPTSGQCATTTTLAITVNSNVTPTFSPVAAICSGGTLSALPTTSINGITGTWSPMLNNTSTTTYTFTPTSGQCATTTTLAITVNSNVTPTFSPVAAICSGGTLSALPTTSINGITGTWSPALNNTATTTYTFTPTAGQCATTTTLEIVVYRLPNIEIISGCVDLDYVLQANIVSNASYQWFDSSGNLLGTQSSVVVTLSGIYEVQVNLNGCLVSEFVNVDNAFCSIPKGVSPNNDGANDFWDLSNFNVQKAQIYNRYGTEVYSKLNYLNEWNGNSDTGKELPSGTYYYVLTFANGKVKTGWVYINRQN